MRTGEQQRARGAAAAPAGRRWWHAEHRPPPCLAACQLPAAEVHKRSAWPSSLLGSRSVRTSGGSLDAGFEVCKQLAAHKATVVMAGRNEEKSKELSYPGTGCSAVGVHTLPLTVRCLPSLPSSYDAAMHAHAPTRGFAPRPRTDHMQGHRGDSPPGRPQLRRHRVPAPGAVVAAVSCSSRRSCSCRRRRRCSCCGCYACYACNACFCLCRLRCESIRPAAPDVQAAQSRTAAGTAPSWPRPHPPPLHSTHPSSVRRCAEAFLARGLPLHCLVCNAGLGLPQEPHTEDGFETTVGEERMAG